MKTFKKIILFVFIGAAFATCKKEELPQSSTIGQPVFSFNGTIDGASKNWQAGVNNYYMYSSFSQNSSGVYAFTGRLQSTSTANNSIQISINDYKVSASNASVAGHIDSSFSQPLYNYSIPGGISDTTYSITFTPRIYAGTPLSYLYNFGDGTTSNAVSPTHIYKASGTYNTSLTINFSTGPVTMSNPITIYPAQPQLWVDSLVSKIGTITGDSVNFGFKATIKNGISPYTYSWNFGDGGILTSPSNTDTITVPHTYSYFDTIGIIRAMVYPVSLKITDAAGSSESYNYKVWDTNSVYSGGGLIDYKMTPPTRTIITDTLFLSDVTINYTDGSGTLYTSNNTAQPKSSSFQITSVSNYQNNLNNYPTKMLTVTFNCMLYNGGNSIPASGTAVIAAAYH